MKVKIKTRKIYPGRAFAAKHVQKEISISIRGSHKLRHTERVMVGEKNGRRVLCHLFAADCNDGVRQAYCGDLRLSYLGNAEGITLLRLF